jgi:hypothetical protein
MTRNGFGLAVVAVSSLVLLTPPAGALRFTATLNSIKVEARPGQTLHRHFGLTLPADERRTQFRARIEDFWQSEDGQESFYRPIGSVPRSCGPWVTLNPLESSVDPGDTLDVRLSIAIPATQSPGGYWCVLTVDQVADPRAAPAGVGVQFLASVSVGLFVYLPPVETAARIEGVELTATSASLRLLNDGNAPLAAEGRFEFLRPGEDTPVATVPLPRTTVFLFPVSRRRITVALPDPSRLPSGHYLVRAILDVGLDHYLGVQREVELHREPAWTASP